LKTIRGCSRTWATASLTGAPMVSRLTYRFQPKAGLDGEPRSTADYEYIVFGGLDPDNAIRPGLRRMLPLDVLAALRDAEKDLATWRRSPLRPLIEGLAAGLDEADRAAIQEAVDTAQNTLAERDEVLAVAETISGRLEQMVGPAHATTISPCHSSPSTQVTPVTKRLDSMVRRIAPVSG
jgi:putative ATP-dependent endonuclease of OLD family